jgi:hypothetical protein
MSRESLVARVGEKFGGGAIDLAVAISERRVDEDGIELSADERREDLLQRLVDAPERARWVVAADVLHEAGTLLAELRRTEFPESVWGRGPRDQGLEWLRRVYDRLSEIGFTAPIMSELHALVEELERHWRALAPAAGKQV